MHGPKRKLSDGVQQRQSKRTKKSGKDSGLKNGQNLLRSNGAGGPGIFLTCVRGRERKAGLELIDCLEELVETLYPGVEPIECDEQRTNNLDEVDFDALHNDVGALGFDREKAPQMTSKDQRVATVDDDIEEQIQAELRCMGAATSGLDAESKQGSRRRTKARWFDVVETGTDCLTFIAISRPLCAVRLTYAFLDQVRSTGQARCKFVQRLTPVVDVVRANAGELSSLAKRALSQHFTVDESLSFKIDPRLRNHDVMSKADIIRIVLAAMPDHGDHRPQLTGAQRLIVVEVYKSVLGVSVLHDFEGYRRLNPQMIAENTRKTHNVAEDDGKSGNPPSRVALFNCEAREEKREECRD